GRVANSFLAEFLQHIRVYAGLDVLSHNEYTRVGAHLLNDGQLGSFQISECGHVVAPLVRFRQTDLPAMLPGLAQGCARRNRLRHLSLDEPPLSCAPAPPRKALPTPANAH